MKSYTIAITTFSKRFELLESLISSISNYGIKNNIIICINGEKDGSFDEDYRKKVLNLCLSANNIFPIFFIETRGLAKMWNTIAVHSPLDDILILNDDIEILGADIFNNVEQHINSNDYFGLTKINNTFSFFILNKVFLDQINYFDERLLGFGEEDGDITYRVHKYTNNHIKNISIPNLRNIVSPIRQEEISNGIGKYSKYNRNYIFNEKYKSSPKGFAGMFHLPVEQVLPDENPYPYENYFLKNKNKLYN